MSPAGNEAAEQSAEARMIPQELIDTAIGFEIIPFPDVQADKAQGMKVLEEASEFREAYDKLAQAVAADVEQEFVNTMTINLIMEAADVIQAVINTLYAVFDEKTDEVIQEGCGRVYVKNVYRGRYGEEALSLLTEDNQEEEQTEEE